MKPVVLNTAQLRQLCDQAEALRFCHGPNAKFWEDVDPDGFHVTAQAFVHQPILDLWEGVDHPWDFSHGGGKNIRTLVLCKMRGRMEPLELLCEFDYEAYMALVRKTRKAKAHRPRKGKLCKKKTAPAR